MSGARPADRSVAAPPEAHASAETDERAARDLLAECAGMLARRIRSIRHSDRDWSMRTSELVSSGFVRILGATDGGRAPLTRGRFIGLLESVARSVVIDGIRRRSVRRAAQQVLREQVLREHAPRDDGELDAHGDARSGAHRDETRAIAARLVAEMSDEERMLVRLRLEGREWTEVAAALGITGDAARQRWVALRKRMRAFAGEA